MSQRRSYSNSNDFNLDDLFRPEPGGQQSNGPESVAQPPAQAPAHPQQPQPPQYQGFQEPYQGAPEYYGAPQPQQAEAAPETQYLPPYPTSSPAPGAPQTFGGQTFGGHGQAGPGQGGQSYGGQSFGGQQFGVPQQQPYGAPAAPGYPPAPPAYAPEVPSGERRPNNKLIIGGVVAGLAAAGILVAVLMSGDDSAGPKKPAAAKASATAPAATGSGTGVSPEMQAQAKALSDLLGTANSSRQAVVSAVGSVGRCEKLPESQAALTQAATQRDALVTGLAGLKVDKLPSGPQLADQLKQAWVASATADREYAAWAGDSLAGCDPNKHDNPHFTAGGNASGTATTAKTQASTLWNAIASQTGLATKDKTEL